MAAGMGDDNYRPRRGDKTRKTPKKRVEWRLRVADPAYTR